MNENDDDDNICAVMNIHVSRKVYDFMLAQKCSFMRVQAAFLKSVNCS